MVVLKITERREGEISIEGHWKEEDASFAFSGELQQVR